MHEIDPVSTDVYRVRTLIANVYFIQTLGGWILVDAGMPGTATTIIGAAEQLFGAGTHPQSIVLTHGHFDHVGALHTLAAKWNVPIYAHPLELPYLTGRSPYPPPDPAVGGGVLAWLSPLYPRGPYDFSPRINVVPQQGLIAELPGWTWVHTPGHTGGHISLFREADRTLIAGDAVVTTRQESMSAVLQQREEVWRPPAYYTSDWEAAAASVRMLANLEPEYLATGHGHVLTGQPMRDALHTLADNFEQVRPQTGRYVALPAITDSHGIVSVPPRASMPVAWRAAAAIGAIGIGALLFQRASRHLA